MLGNWIRQTTTTTGTGNLTLATASGYSSFSDQFATGQRFQYQILDDSTGAPIESGIGYLSGGALVRERIECTMVSGVFDNSTPSAVSLAAGTKRVICSGSQGSLDSSAPGVWNQGSGFAVYGPMFVTASGNTVALTADRAYAMPARRTVNAEIDALIIRVTTAGAASTQAKAAVFSIGPDGLPDVNLAETSTAAVDSTGSKVMTFSAAFRPPPRFFLCLLSNGAPTVVGSNSGSLENEITGVNSALSASKFIHHVGATSLTFPTPWTPVGNATNTSCPLVYARCI